jgi:hypothetical protein
MHVEPPCEQGVASTDRTWGGINEPPDRGSIRARVKPSRVQLAVSKPPGGKFDEGWDRDSGISGPSGFRHWSGHSHVGGS